MSAVIQATSMSDESLQDYMIGLGKAARSAAEVLAQLRPEQKNTALLQVAQLLNEQREALKQANQRDLQQARADGLDAAMIDRLELNDARIDAMIEGLQQVAALPDPVGEISEMDYRPSGIQVGKMRVPLGVIGIIYESRPNVTIDAASLCLKSGNASILRGGKEALHSNQAILECIQSGLKNAGLPQQSVQVINTTDRAAVGLLLTLEDYVDVIIPRGGKGLIERVSREAKIPVIKHLDGICHVYVDDQADLDKAFDIALNSKTHRYGVCNAMETLLLHRDIAAALLPRLNAAYREREVELRGCAESLKIDPQMLAAVASDWDEEYLAPVLSIRLVENMDEAIQHINQHGSHHTDAMVCENYTRAREFLARVDSSSVMINASTRFADGFEYGLGAEIGISTDKIHARGPVGLKGLTSQKYIVLGDGQIRQ